MKKLLISPLILFVLIVIQPTVFAQDTGGVLETQLVNQKINNQGRGNQSSNSGNLKTKMYTVADVSIENAMVLNRKKNDEIPIAFDIINNEDRAQPEVSYIIRAYKVDANGKNRQLADISVFKDTFSLDNKEKIHKSFNYYPPKSFNGDYDLDIIVANQSGVIFASQTIPFVSIRINEGVTINQSSCYLTIGNEEDKYSLEQGVDLKPNEKLFLHCEKVKNNLNQDVFFVPISDIYRRSFFGKKVLSFAQLSKKQTISANKEQSLTVEIPVIEKPQSYTALVNLQDENHIVMSNAIPVHYVVVGESATIINVAFNKFNYKKGEKAHLDILVSPSAHNFQGRRVKNVPQDKEREVIVRIIDAQNESCAKELRKKIDNTKFMYSFDVEINKNCSNPIASVGINTVDGQILTHDNFRTGIVSKNIHNVQEIKRTKKVNKNKTIGWLVVIIVVIVFLLLVKLIRNKKNRKTSTLSILLLVMAGLLGGNMIAQAKSITLYTYFANGPSKGTTYTTLIIYYDTAKAAYMSCENVQAKYSTTVTTCNNTEFTGQLSVDGHSLVDVHRDSLGNHGATTYGPGINYYNLGRKSPGNHSMLYEIYWKDTQGELSGSDTVPYRVYNNMSECGSANYKTYKIRPASGLCSNGNATWKDGSARDGTWNWDCNAGCNVVHCLAYREKDKQPTCGSANGGEFVSKPTTGLCGLNAKATGVTEEPNRFWWNCNGSGGSIGCQAKKIKNNPPPPPSPEAPQCGSAASVASVYSCPTSNLCSVGYATNVDSSGFESCTWECRTGSGGNTGIRHCSVNKKQQQVKSCEVDFYPVCGPEIYRVSVPYIKSNYAYDASIKSWKNDYLCSIGDADNPRLISTDPYERKWHCKVNDHIRNCYTISNYSYATDGAKKELSYDEGACGDAQARTFDSRPPDDILCKFGTVKWLDKDANSGKWRWECEFLKFDTNNYCYFFKKNDEERMNRKAGAWELSYFLAGQGDYSPPPKYFACPRPAKKLYLICNYLGHKCYTSTNKPSGWRKAIYRVVSTIDIPGRTATAECFANKKVGSCGAINGKFVDSDTITMKNKDLLCDGAELSGIQYREGVEYWKCGEQWCYAFSKQACADSCGSADGKTLDKKPNKPGELCSGATDWSGITYTDNKAIDGTWNWECRVGQAPAIKCSARNSEVINLPISENKSERGTVTEIVP